MSSFSSGVGGMTSGANGGRVFIGSFNINSQDLTNEAAIAWLKEAEGADIVALGLQVSYHVYVAVRQIIQSGNKESHFHDAGVLTV